MTNSFTLLGELFDEEGLPWRSCPQFCFLLQWRHNACHGVPNHRYLNCLLTRLFRPRLNKHLSSASLVFVRGNHRWPVQSRRKGPVTRKMLPSSCVSGNSVSEAISPHRMSLMQSSDRLCILYPYPELISQRLTDKISWVTIHVTSF